MGCGRTRPKDELERFVLVGDTVVADPDKTHPGRGAYLCGDDESCRALAVRRGGFNRSFRTRVEPPVGSPEPQ